MSRFFCAHKWKVHLAVLTYGNAKILQLLRVLKKALSKLEIDKKKCQQRKVKPLQLSKVWQQIHNLVELISKKQKELR